MFKHYISVRRIGFLEHNKKTDNFLRHKFDVDIFDH